RHARSVFTVVKDLSGFVVARIEIYFRLAVYLAFAGLHVVAINGRRRGETGERVKGLAVFAFSAEADGRSDAWQIDFSRELPVQVEELYLRSRVFQIRRDEMIADEAHAFERFAGLRNELFPVRPVRIARINRDDAASRSVQIGAEPEQGAVIAYEIVCGLEFADQFDDFLVRRLKVFEKYSV